MEDGSDKAQNSEKSSSLSSSEHGSSKDNQTEQVEPEQVVLEKKVGLLGSIGLVVGVIIGSGIFISPTGVAEGAGSVGLSLVLWAVGGLVTMFAGLSMAELGTMITKSGGEYIYIKMTLCDWLAYLWTWSQCYLLKPATQAVVSITCAEYILVPIFQDECGAPPEAYTKMLAAVLVLMIALMNVWSVRLAASVQFVFTVAKVIALCIIIVGGMVNMANGKLEYLKTGFEGTNTNPGQIMLGLYSAMFAYDGWNNLNAVIEEVINPAWTLPVSMYIGIPLITILYMLTNISYFTVMNVDGLLDSDAVAMTWAKAVIPSVSWIIPLSVAMSTFGGVNGGFFAVGRLYYTAARESHQPQILSYIQVKRLTPMPAMIVNVPFVFPLVVFIFSVAMVIIPIATAPQMEFLYATIVMLAGFIFYFPFVLCRVKPTCMNNFAIVRMKNTLPRLLDDYTVILSLTQLHRRVMDFLEDKNVQHIDWPAMLRKLNPIENIWSEISHGLNNMPNPPTNVAELTQAVVDIWRDIPDQISIQRRPHEVLNCLA
ncbi:hypothetical protein LSH36_362g01000 [Paralvinella palmiformis]|uniref:Uncharacterized protein n=1 Tax=Paralvinella palmiformis TaxID=53620 RepID=A0AAD9JF31_9ANNE|nr:hypothetical protein LSH36_362g01000 [Paralvinella palmiformis]